MNRTRPVLIVDDEPMNLAAMRQVLEDDYPLAFANGGLVALEAARRLRPALVLLDIEMPDMDGHEVCRQLKADPQLAHIPVVFVTAKDDSADLDSGLRLGAAAYLHKPLEPEKVLACVRAHLLTTP